MTSERWVRVGRVTKHFSFLGSFACSQSFNTRWRDKQRTSSSNLNLTSTTFNFKDATKTFGFLLWRIRFSRLKLHEKKSCTSIAFNIKRMFIVNRPCWWTAFPAFVNLNIVIIFDAQFKKLYVDLHLLWSSKSPRAFLRKGISIVVKLGRGEFYLLISNSVQAVRELTTWENKLKSLD